MGLVLPEVLIFQEKQEMALKKKKKQNIKHSRFFSIGN